MTPAERLRELAVRHAAFAWLDAQRSSGRETLTQGETSNVMLAGERRRLMPTQQGIWKPADLRAALAIRTVYRPEGADRPYDDVVGSDGFTATRCVEPIPLTIRIALCGRQCVSGFR